MGEVDAERLRARLAALFFEELQDNVRALTRGLADLERSPGVEVDRALVQDLFRAAHSLKGAAHSAGVEPAVGPCRRLEKALAELRDEGRVADDELLRSFAEDLARLAALEQQLAGSAAAKAVDADGGAPLEAGRSSREVRARVGVDVLDGLVLQAGALVSASQRLAVVHSALLEAGDLPTSVAREAVAVERALGRAVAQVTGIAQQLRLQPVADVTAGLEHAVREVARATGKPVTLVLEGGDVELDRDVGDAIREPLLHLVRNAVDHGIEPPPARASTGKPAIGTVRVSTALIGSRVRVAVSDDGGGMDVDRLQAAAGVSSSSLEAAVELAFRPGVSTATSVSDVSGRGVGLDAVRARVEALGGSVQLRTEGGAGTEVVLDLPMTLAVLRVAVVAAGGELVALPSASVERVRRLSPGEPRHVEGRPRVLRGGAMVPAISLGAALGFDVPSGQPLPGIVVELAAEHGVLLVDRVEDELEALLQGLPRRATTAGTVSGAVVLPSGRPALVVNPSACLRVGAVAGPPPAPVARRTRPTVLLVEDTLTTRVLEHSVLEGAGYEVVDAADGVEAWHLLAERDVDVVVSDVDMPRMGGIELCRAIRSSRFGDLPVVLVTSLGRDEDVHRGMEAGANAYLVKSAFEQAALLDAVRRLL